MGGLRYCFEEDHVKSTLARSKPSDLAVIDSDGISKAVMQALAAAAISEIPSHAAIMFTADGFPIMHQSYKHEVVHKDTEDGNN